MGYSLSFSKAIMVVIFIADKIRQKQYEFLSTARIAEIINIPRPTLVKILQGLSAAGIVETKEGKLGGIRLLKQPKDITIADILDATENKPLFQMGFNVNAQGKRPDAAQKLVADLLTDAEHRMKASLAQKSLEQILIDIGK